MTGIDLAALLGRALVALLLQIALIILLAWLVIHAIGLLGRKTAARFARPEFDLGRRARLETLLDAAAHTLQVIVGLAAALMVLASLGVNIAPLLAGVGVAGLAISLGAQTLIKDFIGGALILVENQYRVGDVIQVGTTAGTVEQITLRATHVRDTEGRLWIVPNGEVRVVSNATRDWARAVVDVNVPADTDMSRALAALQAAMEKAQEDTTIKGDLLDAPQVHGWNNLGDTTVQIRLLAKTAPGKQWDVSRVLRQYALSTLRSITSPEPSPGPDVSKPA